MLVRKRLDNGWRSGALDSSRDMVPTVYGMNLWTVSFYGWYKVGPVKACHKHSGIFGVQSQAGSRMFHAQGCQRAERSEGDLSAEDARAPLKVSHCATFLLGE